MKPNASVDKVRVQNFTEVPQPPTVEALTEQNLELSVRLQIATDTITKLKATVDQYESDRNEEVVALRVHQLMKNHEDYYKGVHGKVRGSLVLRLLRRIDALKEEVAVHLFRNQSLQDKIYGLNLEMARKIHDS